MSRIGVFALAALLLGPACSDDDDGGKTDMTPDQIVTYDLQPADNGVPADKGPGGDQGPPADKGPPTEGGPQPDTGSKDQGPQPDYGANPPNSGAICTVPQNQCPNTQDECIIVAGGNQQKGMCLIKCTTKGAACPTKNPATQKSICFLDFTGPPAATYCAYMCLYQGTTYTCPTGSTCQSISANTSVCVQQ